jgi:hypothetical protein
MKCPNGGAANLIHDTRDLPYTYKSSWRNTPACSMRSGPPDLSAEGEPPWG